MKSVKANHLTGKNVIESHACIVNLFPPLSVAMCRDTNWCINTPAKRLSKKRTGKVVAYAGWVGVPPLEPDSAGIPKILFCTEGLELLQGQWSSGLQEWWWSPSQTWNHCFPRFALEEMYELSWLLLSVRLLKHEHIKVNNRNCLNRTRIHIMSYTKVDFTKSKCWCYSQ